MAPLNEGEKNSGIRECRASIDNMDGAFMFILSERMRTVSRIMQLKKIHRLPPDISRERSRDMDRTYRLAEKLGLSESLMEEILLRIYIESKKASDDGDFNGHDDPGDEDFRTGMKELRKTLLSLDSAFCHLLSERFRLVAKIGVYKGRYGLPPLSENRWKEILTTRTETARMLGISTGLVSDILEMIHREALRIEEGLSGR